MRELPESEAAVGEAEGTQNVRVERTTAVDDSTCSHHVPKIAEVGVAVLGVRHDDNGDIAALEDAPQVRLARYVGIVHQHLRHDRPQERRDAWSSRVPLVIGVGVVRKPEDRRSGGLRSPSGCCADTEDKADDMLGHRVIDRPSPSDQLGGSLWREAAHEQPGIFR